MRLSPLNSLIFSICTVTKFLFTYGSTWRRSFCYCWSVFIHQQTVLHVIFLPKIANLFTFFEIYIFFSSSVFSITKHEEVLEYMKDNPKLQRDGILAHGFFRGFISGEHFKNTVLLCKTGIEYRLLPEQEP